MTFFKSLIVFIVIILISKVIFSTPGNVSNKSNSTNQNVTLFGTVKCTPCEGSFVVIAIHENGSYRDQILKNCNDRFYINTYTSSPTPKDDFTGSFFYTCNKTTKTIMDRKPKFVTELWSYYYFTFEIVNLDNTESGNNLLKKN